MSLQCKLRGYNYKKKLGLSYDWNVLLKWPFSPRERDKTDSSHHCHWADSKFMQNSVLVLDSKVFCCHHPNVCFWVWPPTSHNHYTQIDIYVCPGVSSFSTGYSQIFKCFESNVGWNWKTVAINNNIWREKWSSHCSTGTLSIGVWMITTAELQETPSKFFWKQVLPDVIFFGIAG